LNTRFQEIDDTVHGLNNATDAHFKWLVNILRFVAVRDIELPEITCCDAHNQCEFGLWINEKLKEERGDASFLLDINKTHIAVHHACLTLVNSILYQTNDAGVYDRFETALLGFTASLNRYKVHLVQSRTCYDALTGLPLRRMLDESFDNRVLEQSEDGLYLLLLDIDHFKNINDTYGHLTGDAVLRSLALNLEKNVRKSEPVYRYGGEEFIILLRADNDNAASIAAERVRKMIAETEIIAGEHTLKITFTAGLTKIQQGEVLRDVLERADMALYQGKQTGRNRTMLIHRHRDIVNVNNG